MSESDSEAAAQARAEAEAKARAAAEADAEAGADATAEADAATPDDDAGDDDVGAYDEYVRYAKVLQAWFVAFGIGAIVLFVSKPEAFKSLPDTARFWIPIVLLAAVGFQVVLAIINKYFNYRNYQKGPGKGGILSSPGWIVLDVAFDLSTVACIVVACVLFIRTGFNHGSASEITETEFEVLRIVDGDTFEIHYDGELTKCRFVFVDAPERGESGFKEATDKLSKLIAGEVVTISFTDPRGRKRDNFGRLLVSVSVDGVDAERELLTAGLVELYGDTAPPK